jgi:hypothetical protein
VTEDVGAELTVKATVTVLDVTPGAATVIVAL